ncbi:MAG: hypothetical protein AMXMBFR34_04740 [Myxococcaceae bacterium]
MPAAPSRPPAAAPLSRPASVRPPPSSARPTNPARPNPPPKREAFIGHDAATMMDEGSFEELEAKYAPKGATNASPAHASDEDGDDEVRAAADDDSSEDDSDSVFEEDADSEAEDSGDEDSSDEDSSDEEEDSDASGDDEDGFPEEDEDDGAGRAQETGPSGRPVDRDGVEWDYVTSEGMGFNDDMDEDAMTFEKNGKTYFKPDWGPWKARDWVGYWKKTFDLEAAQEKGDKAHLAAIKKHGLRNRNHLKRVRETFMRHYAKDPEFTNAALIARQEQTRDKMKDALEPGMLDPIEGVSLQLWAAINAQRLSLQPADFVKLLAKHKVDEARFARADEGWQARMSDQSNPDAAMAIATEYGKAFAGAGAGQFGASAQAASGSMGVNDKVAGKNVKGAEPMSFERYVEVMAAQSCWAEQGKDVNELLSKVFKMNAVDWSNASAYWSQKMSTDIELMTTKFPALQAKYTQKYSAGQADADDDLEV